MVILRAFFWRLWGHPLKCHEYTRWHTETHTLVSWLGTTKDEVQQRECHHCGYIQRASLEVARKLAECE